MFGTDHDERERLRAWLLDGAGDPPAEAREQMFRHTFDAPEAVTSAHLLPPASFLDLGGAGPADAVADLGPVDGPLLPDDPHSLLAADDVAWAHATGLPGEDVGRLHDAASDDVEPGW